MIKLIVALCTIQMAGNHGVINLSKKLKCQKKLAQCMAKKKVGQQHDYELMKCVAEMDLK